MTLDPATIFSGPTISDILESSAGICAGAAGLAALVWRPLGRAILPTLAETYLRDFLPFDRVLADDETIRCKDGRLVQIVALGGADTGAMTARDRDELFDKRRAFFDACEEQTSIDVAAITLRRRTSVMTDSRWDNPPVQQMFDRYHTAFHNSFVNSHYLILSVAGGVKGGRTKLREAIAQAVASLDDYAPTILNNGKKAYSPLLTFWSDVINPGNPGPIGHTRLDLSPALCGTTVDFLDDGGVMEFRDGPHVTYGVAIGIPKWGDRTAEATMARLMALPCEMTVLQLAQPQSLLQAQALLDRRKKWVLGGKWSADLAEQFKAADSMLTPGTTDRQSKIRYQMTIFLYASSREELDHLIQAARVQMLPFGVRLIREASGVAERLWFSQFPGTRQWVHSQDFFSGNVADVLSLDAPAVGLERSDWSSEPIVLMRQLSGAPYKFQFHVSEEPEEVGHMCLIGPTGTGKTFFMNFLIAASLKVPGLRWFRFDRDLGAFPFTACLGQDGNYLALQTDMEDTNTCAVNPFQMAPTPANKAFLLQWLTKMAGTDPKTLEEIGRFIQGVQTPGLPMEKRTLTDNIVTFFHRDGQGFANLKKWADPNLYGRYINATRDTFDPVTGGRVLSIDVTQLFKDDNLAPVMSEYFLHRILGATREAKVPFGVFVDETEPMVRASPEQFGGDLKRMLQEIRRARGIVVLAFQRAKAISELGIQDLVLGQCPTLVFFRNPKLRAGDVEGFDLTDGQIAIIRGKSPLVRGKKHYVLLVRHLPNRVESVVIDFDLTMLDEYRRLLRGGRAAIDAVVAAKQAWGPDWLSHYLYDDFAEEEEEDDDE